MRTRTALTAVIPVMRKAFILIALAALALPAAAQQPFADVPRDHWSHKCAEHVASRLEISPYYPNGTYGDKRALTRYEIAVTTAKAHQMLERRESALATSTEPPRLSREEWQCLHRLAEEYKPEILALRQSPQQLAFDLRRLERRKWETFHNGDPARRPAWIFADVPRDHWAYEATILMAETGLMIGYPR
jgi:hypothetical protein